MHFPYLSTLLCVTNLKRIYKLINLGSSVKDEKTFFLDYLIKNVVRNVSELVPHGPNQNF